MGVGRRDAKDNRIGTPVTAKLLGDPDPDRAEKAEALRLSILSADKRRARSLPQIDEQTLALNARKGERKDQSRQPDIPTPLGGYRPIPRSHALYEFTRGDQVLLFASYRAAGRCFLMREPKKNELAWMRNQANGITKTCFGGWTVRKLHGHNTRSEAARRMPR